MSEPLRTAHQPQSDVLARPPRKSPRVLFGVMSAVAKPSTVEQLVASLQSYPVVIHHDFSQQPRFAIKGSNVRFVPDPKRTGYGVWAFTEGVIHLVKHCLEHCEFDYFQLLTPACLPIKPLAQFEAYLANSIVDAHAEFVDLWNDRDAMMTLGHRVYPHKSLRRALQHRARRLYFGPNPDQIECFGISIKRGPASLVKRPLASAALAITRMIQLGGSPIPDAHLRPMTGGAYFGATREVCEYLVRRITEPELNAYFRRVSDRGEYGFATLFGNSNFRFGPFNTFVNTYDGWHPRMFEINDLDRLAGMPHFFARKFPDDATAPVRLRLLERVMEELPKI